LRQFGLLLANFGLHLREDRLRFLNGQARLAAGQRVLQALRQNVRIELHRLLVQIGAQTHPDLHAERVAELVFGGGERRCGLCCRGRLCGSPGRGRFRGFGWSRWLSFRRRSLRLGNAEQHDSSRQCG